MTSALPRVVVEKPPVPVLWLDSFFAIDIARLNTLREPERSRTTRLFVLVKDLSQAGLLICPESGQSDEYGPEERIVRRSFNRISHGIRMPRWQSIMDEQVICGLEAYLTRASKIEVPLSAFFPNNLSEQLNKTTTAERALGDLRVSPRPSWERAELQAIKVQVAEEWESIRAEAVQKKTGFPEQFTKEQRSYFDNIVEILGRLVGNGDLTTGEYLEYEKVNLYYRAWVALGGQLELIEEFLAFFSSPYFCSLPSWEIRTQIHADIITGPVKLQLSDMHEGRGVSLSSAAYCEFCIDGSKEGQPDQSTWARFAMGGKALLHAKF